MATKSTGDQPTKEQGMVSGEGQVAETQKPVDKVRELAGKAKEAVTARKAEIEAQEQQRFADMKEQLARCDERSRELFNIYDSLNEAKSEIDGLTAEAMSEELEAYKADLINQMEQTRMESKKNEAERATIAEDPFYKKMAAAQEAASLQKIEAEQKAATEKENQETTDALAEVVLEFSSVGQQWRTRLAATAELNTRASAQSSKCDKVGRAFYRELQNLFDEIPSEKREKMERELTQYSQGSEAWFNAIEEHFKPSILPFLDKPLKALLAMRKDPRFAEIASLISSTRELTQKANASRDADIAFADEHLAKWMAEGSAFRSFDWGKNGWSRLANQNIPPEQKQARANAWATLKPSLTAVEGMVNSACTDYGAQQSVGEQLRWFKNFVSQRGN